MILDDFLELLEGVRPSGGGYTALCPAHDDSDPSLSVSQGERGIILSCMAGCDTSAILSSLGLQWSDLFHDSRPKRGEPEAIYRYEDEQGNNLFEVVRMPGKRFSQRHWDPTSEEARDGWVWNLEGVRRPLFGLPLLLSASQGVSVYVCEGEKDVEALRAAGKVATCNPGGAGKWREEHTESLRGRSVIIVQHRDEKGRSHAKRVREALSGVATQIWVVQAKIGKDAFDHLASGLTPEDMPIVRDRAHRGIVTAREMAERASLHLDATEYSEPEFIVQDFGLRDGLRFRSGRLYVLGGYTGDGKTNTALQITRRYMEEQAGRLGFFTYEMSEEDLRNRLIAHAGIPLFRVERPWFLTPEERARYEVVTQEIAEWQMEIIYDTSLPADGIVEHTVNQEYDFVVIDHVHELPWGRERRNLEAQITKIKNLSLEYNIPILLLAQLRRFERGRGMQNYPPPTLQDLRETETLGSSSALAMTIYRHRDDVGSYSSDHSGTISVLKNRHGRVDSSPVKFNPNTMMFEKEEFDGEHVSPSPDPCADLY